MSIKEGRDYIYLVWKDVETRRKYIVGQLSKNGQFEFSYGFEVQEAIKNGFKKLIPFEKINKTYKSDILFPAFSSRLPDKKRKGIKDILLKYDLTEYDDYKLLKRSGAKLPIDNLEFIDPIFDEEKQNIKRIFYLAGPRHYLGCEGKDCTKSENIELGEKLQLILEPENIYDSNAIKVLKSNRVHIGYISRFYCKSIIKLLNKQYNYICTVYDIQKNNNCNECIKIELKMNKR